MRILSQISLQTLIRSFIQKLLSQKIRITFFSTTDIIKYYKSILPYQILEHLTLTSIQQSSSKQLAIITENHQHINLLRNSVRVILSCYRRLRVTRKALIKRMTKHQAKIVKMQALLKGHLFRVKNKALVKKIKIDGHKKTKKYQMISKLQANIKGFLFRKRRVRALERLN